MIQAERIKPLNNKRIKSGKYVLYWMQASQRAEYNHALEYAIQQANDLNLPVLVLFGICENFPEANERHFYFMLQGLKETQAALKERGIKMVVWRQSPELAAVKLAASASLVVVDRGYLRIQRNWRQFVAEHIECPLIQVESDVIVPVEVASPKEEFSAATIRPKILKHLDFFLKPHKPSVPRKSSLHFDIDSINLENVVEVLRHLKIDRSVSKVAYSTGGTSQAKKLLTEFIKFKLDTYPQLRNDPNADNLSKMSPYLHFGQISPLYIALQVIKSGSQAVPVYLEELIVRRELSMNFVYYNPAYDSFNCLPAWAQKTLLQHKSDKREYIYSPEELEQALTHDPYWNAAQNEMRLTGKMHGYMRMYWGKKILEWTQNPEEAYRIALYLNNKYELDGRDPNGFAGVAWCFGKHDRPWQSRLIFGNIRFMNAAGLKRKFDADGYVAKINALTAS